MTPEGRVKKKIKVLLDKYYGSIYFFMSVPSGYGKPTLDYLGIFHGLGFAIEAKAFRKDLTTRQEGHRDDIVAAGGKVFVIDGDETLSVFAAWLEQVEKEHARQ